MGEPKNEQKTGKGLVVTAPTPTTDLVKTWQLHIHYYSDLRSGGVLKSCLFFARCLRGELLISLPFSLRSLSHVKIVTTHVAVRVIVKVSFVRAL